MDLREINKVASKLGVIVVNYSYNGVIVKKISSTGRELYGVLDTETGKVLIDCKYRNFAEVWHALMDDEEGKNNDSSLSDELDISRCLLPKDMYPDMSAWKELGFRFHALQGDDVFYSVDLPSGWSVVPDAPDSQYHFNICDSNNQVVGHAFIKKDFWDRRGRMELYDLCHTKKPSTK